MAEVPAPHRTPNHLLIKTRASLISMGTEKMLIDFANAGWIHKARQQPERVRQVLSKIRTDGLIPTLAAVRAKLDQPVPLGYCNVGSVLEVGEGIGHGDFEAGTRVVSNGPHAEVVCVPRNLCARVPDDVSDEEAAFTVVAAIALNGIRLANPTFGEKFMVIGLGLIGLITVQLLRANGCEVLGTDIREDRLRLGQDFWAKVVNGQITDIAAAAHSWTSGVGVDGVIITASAETDEIIHQAAEACRKRGRIILVGVAGLHLRRDDFYRKELTFQVSCSYGPGRYDADYETRSFDYPLPYVRWTEQRNFEAVLNAMRCRALNVRPLITRRIRIDEALSAYELLRKDSGALGILLEYPAGQDRDHLRSNDPGRASGGFAIVSHRPAVGLIGAGNYARSILAPAIAATSARLACVADLNPVCASHLARKFHFEQATTDYQAILGTPSIEAVFIATGHSTHAQLVCEALLAGKHVFVEKPLCLTLTELQEVAAAYRRANEDTAKPRSLMVGFNRRFSAHTARLKELLRDRTEPLCMNLTVNAGSVPQDHWLHDPARGGGRILGEGCHFFDLLAYLAGGHIKRVSAMMAGPGLAVRSDKMSILLSLGDGSIGTVNYFGNGCQAFPKETLEIFSEGRILRLENFRVLRGYGFKAFKSFKTWRQDKGHKTEIALFLDRVARIGPPLIRFAELENVSQASFAAMASATTGNTVQLF